MGWIDRLRNLSQWADPVEASGPYPETVSRAMTPPIYHYSSQRRGISGTNNQPSARQLVTDGFSGDQAIASRAIANRVSDLELVVRSRSRDTEGTFVVEDVDDHALRFTLDKPNPILTRRQMLHVTSTWLTQAGEAFWLIVTNGARKPVELWPMSPANMEKLVSDTAPISGFVFHGEAGETRYTLDEVIYFFDPDPDDPFAGLGILGPQARQFDAQSFANETVRHHFQNDATPKVVLTADTEADLPDKAQRDAFFADWQNRYNARNGEQHGTPAFIPSGFTAKEMGGLSSIEDVQGYMEYERDRILMANGVPRAVLGSVEDANRANMEAVQYAYDRHTIKPQAGTIADALTNQLAQPFYGNEISIAFADFVSIDEEFRLKQEAQDLTLKVKTVNHVREERGLDPVPWGEEPIGTPGDVPYFADDPGSEDDSPLTVVGDGDDDEPGSGDPEPEEDAPEVTGGRVFVARMASRRVRSAWTADAAWSRSIRRESVLVPSMTSALRKVFAGQKSMILEALPRFVEQQSRADFWDELFAVQDFSRLFRVLVDPLRTDAMDISAVSTLDALEMPPVLEFNATAIKRMDAQGAQLVTFANDATKAALRRAMSKGLAEGESLADLSKRVRGVMNGASKRRARVIARTEVKHATQVGQLAGFESSDVVERKRWITARDKRVRDFEMGAKTSHRIDGQTVEVNSHFTLGDGEKAEGPGVGVGGARLSAHNAINCRCDTVPVLEGVKYVGPEQGPGRQ